MTSIATGNDQSRIGLGFKAKLILVGELKLAGLAENRNKQVKVKGKEAAVKMMEVKCSHYAEDKHVLVSIF